MSVTVSIPTIMRSLTGGKKLVEATGSTVAAVIEDLEASYAGMQGRLLKDGKLNRYVNFFIGDDNARFVGGLEADVPEGIMVTIVPAVAGG